MAVLGDGCARPGRANLRLIRRAIREGWPLPKEKRVALMRHLSGIINTGHTCNCLAAIRCILEADQANLNAALKVRDRG
jgi:hypothetical protein